MSFVPLFFLFSFFWLLVCGVGLVINCFGNKHKPLYFWQFYFCLLVL
jgi:hypothetical protein